MQWLILAAPSGKSGYGGDRGFGSGGGFGGGSGGSYAGMLSL